MAQVPGLGHLLQLMALIRSHKSTTSYMLMGTAQLMGLET